MWFLEAVGELLPTMGTCCGDPAAWCWPPGTGDQYRNSSVRAAGKKCRQTCLQWCKGSQRATKIQITRKASVCSVEDHQWAPLKRKRVRDVKKGIFHGCLTWSRKFSTNLVQYILILEWHWDAFCVIIPLAPCEGSSLALICNNTHSLLHSLRAAASAVFGAGELGFDWSCLLGREK